MRENKSKFTQCGNTSFYKEPLRSDFDQECKIIIVPSIFFTTSEHYNEQGIHKPMNKETSEIIKIICKMCDLLILVLVVEANMMQIFTI